MNAGESPTLFAVHLPTRIRLSSTISSLSSKPIVEMDAGSRPDDRSRVLPDLKQARRENTAGFEKEYLQELIRQTRGDIQEACG